MRVYVHELETLLPPYEATQATLARTLGEWGDPVTARRVRHFFQKSGIESGLFEVLPARAQASTVGPAEAWVEVDA